MKQEELAKENLRAFSQSTQYILDWHQKASLPPPIKHHQPSFTKRLSIPIKEPHPRPHRQVLPKQNAVCRFEYPIIEEVQTNLKKQTKNVFKCQGMLKLAQLRREKEINQKSRLVNQLVESQFSKVTQQIINSLAPVKADKKRCLNRDKLRSNSLPSLNQRVALKIQKRQRKPSQAIMIDHYEPSVNLFYRNRYKSQQSNYTPK